MKNAFEIPKRGLFGYRLAGGFFSERLVIPTGGRLGLPPRELLLEAGEEPMLLLMDASMARGFG